jgi:hypothetical protein
VVVNEGTIGKKMWGVVLYRNAVGYGSDWAREETETRIDAFISPDALGRPPPGRCATPTPSEKQGERGGELN